MWNILHYTYVEILNKVLKFRSHSQLPTFSKTYKLYYGETITHNNKKSWSKLLLQTISLSWSLLWLKEITKCQEKLNSYLYTLPVEGRKLKKSTLCTLWTKLTIADDPTVITINHCTNDYLLTHIYSFMVQKCSTIKLKNESLLNDSE